MKISEQAARLDFSVVLSDDEWSIRTPFGCLHWVSPDCWQFLEEDKDDAWVRSLLTLCEEMSQYDWSWTMSDCYATCKRAREHNAIIAKLCLTLEISEHNLHKIASHYGGDKYKEFGMEEYVHPDIPL